MKQGQVWVTEGGQPPALLEDLPALAYRRWSLWDEQGTTSYGGMFSDEAIPPDPPTYLIVRRKPALINP